MVATKKFLAKGWFPKELPPAFTTEGFARVVIDNSTSLPSKLRDSKIAAKICRHSLVRARNSRRVLGIPNPVPFYNLCSTISDNWNTIKRKIDASPLSVSRPVGRGTYGRAIAPKSDLESVVEARAERRQRGSFLLRSDVTEFYHTIYTHGIPWALHTKPVAKADRSDGLFGNVIDRCARNCQDGQTVGVPIGPDTSLVIAELVLSPVDRKLVGNTALSGLRYYDDFEIAFDRLSDAEDSLSRLHNALADYELQANPRKTDILRLPQPLDLPWVSPIRSFAFRSKPGAQRTDIIKYFDLVFSLLNECPDDNVMVYALARLEDEPLAFATVSTSVFESDLLIESAQRVA